jgi:hypothetical protein
MSSPHKELIARTGRVQSWIDDHTSRLPVSCTVFVVEDEMEGPNGIEASWRFVSHALRFGAGVAIHLSKLRPKGTENGKGLVSSGPVSFGKIYSSLNEILRRGGVYKNGAAVLHLDLNHPDVLDFITVSRAELPWVKRCVNINPHWWNETTQEVKDALLNGIRSGDIWLNKTKVDKNGNRIRGNVCLEVYLPSRGTCLLQHVNLGACDLNDIQGAFVNGMSELCALHGKTDVGASGEYLPPEVDRQVGLGMLGLANLLRRCGVTYADFGLALQDLNKGLMAQTPAHIIAAELQAGILAASHVARVNGMERAFAIAPTASCSYRYKDLDGYTTCPEIAPPIGRFVDRDSGTFGVHSFDYGDVEIASEVGWNDYLNVVNGVCLMLEKTGLFHGYSFNSWSDVVTYNEQFIEDWLASPQTSLYYALQVQPDTLRKDDAAAILDEDYKDIFNFEEDEEICLSCAE